MMDRRLRRIMRPLTKSVRLGAQRWDAVGVRRQAERILRDRGDWEIGPIRRARSGTRIANMRSATGGGDAVLKIADASDGASGLARERLALSRLAAEPRLEILRPLLPEVLDAGTDGGWAYLVQRALPGEPATRRLASQRHRTLPEASAIGARLHAAAAVPRPVGTVEVVEWIERPLSAVRRLVGRRPDSPEARSINRLAARLRAAIEGETVRLGWIHGDLWSDNILVAPDGGGITGIVDWDSSSDAGLAVHDQLHLLLYARKVLAATDIGTEICRALGTDPQWDATELGALTVGTVGLPGPDQASRVRLGVLLYWLRLVMANLARQPKATRSRRWVDDNVRAVLACL
ncbi:MAG: aminoglycoside phosphotransferase family protein [Chloroflexi bacterium]|nr:aminoglycoside phosphotransferase family protein [Chloroflexota bacterium]